MLWPTLHSVESFPAFREKRARGWRLCAAAALIFAASAVCFGFAVAFVSVKGTVSKPLIHGCINYENEHACEGAPEYVPARWFNLSFDLEPWPCVWLGATADVAESACQDPHCKDPLVVVGRPLPGSDRAALQQPPVERLTRLLVLVLVVVVVVLLLHRWRLHRHLWIRLLLLCKLLHPPLRRRPLHERRR